MVIELDIDDGTNDGDDATLRCHFSSRLGSRLRRVIPTCKSQGKTVQRIRSTNSLYGCLTISTRIIG